MTIARRGLKDKFLGQGQRSIAKCVSYTSIYCDVLGVLIDGGSNKFPLLCHQLRASTARRAAWRSRGHKQGRSNSALAGVVTRSV